MNQYAGRIVELRSSAGPGPLLQIECPPGAAPAPGQYLLAHDPSDRETPLALPLFSAGPTDDRTAGFLSKPGLIPGMENSPIPPGWGPGTELTLHGPLGHGFRLPLEGQRIALVALAETIDRLSPLFSIAGDAVLLTGLPLQPAGLPPGVEVLRPEAFREVLGWADFIALDLSIDALPIATAMLGLAEWPSLLPLAQALIASPMPCGGLADCGVCALPGGRQLRLACKDGPVFDLQNIL